MDEMIGNPLYISVIKTDSKEIVNPSDVAPSGGGISLKSTSSFIKLSLTPGNERPIYKIEFPNRKDNLKEVKIELIPLDVSKASETITTDKPNQPIYPTSTERVKEIVITVNSIKEGDTAPTNIEISVKSCSPETTTTTIQPGTTTEGLLFLLIYN